VAVSVSAVPNGIVLAQLVLQLIPAGAEVTVPAPLTDTLMAGEKVAVTATEAFITAVQLAVPVQAPLQPVKLKPGAGLAVKVSEVPTATNKGQLPLVHRVTELEPILPPPTTVVVRVWAPVVPVVLKDTVTTVSALTLLKVQTVVVWPRQAPPQLKKL
jgi:hypothetical protein